MSLCAPTTQRSSAGSATRWSFALLLLTAPGCLGPKRDTYVTRQPIEIEADSEQADRIWNTAGDVLRDHHFNLDRTDWRQGVITTLPETSRVFFEFWREDVQTDEDLWESIINPIRRWAEVRFHPDEQGRWRLLSVNVYKQRLSTLDRQFNSTGAAYQVFGTKLPSTTGLPYVTGERDAWIDIGEDPALAAVILDRICATAGIAGPPQQD